MNSEDKILDYENQSKRIDDTKPLSVKIVFSLIVFKCIVYLSIIGAFYFIKDVDINERTEEAQMKNQIVTQFKIESDNPDYAFGYLIGRLFIPFLLTGSTLVFVHQRKFWLAIFACSLDVLTGLTQGYPILAFIIFVMLLINPTRNYLRRIRLSS